MEEIKIRESMPSDLGSIEALYPAAFPDEDLLPLVRELLQEAPSVVLSLVAVIDTTLVGHVVFTICGIAGRDDNVALLGPLLVAAGQQTKGVGTALMRAGFQRLEKIGIRHIFVLGDPAYYGRLGFKPDRRVVPPYRLPDDSLPDEWRDAWQSLCLGGAESSLVGELSVPKPWREPALWAP